MQLQTSGGLTKEQLDAMKKNAEEMAQQDKERKELAELKNSADTLVWQSESQLEEFKDKIDDELRQEINEQVSKVRELRSNDSANPEDLKAEIEKLNKCMQKIGEKIYEKPGSSDSSADQQSSSESNEDANNSENAEYEEKKEQ